MDWGSLQPLIGTLDPQDQNDIELAFQISEAAHLNQFRASGEPFFTHPLRATYYLLAAGCVHRKHIVACLLHDVPEDTRHLQVKGADYYKRGTYLRNDRGVVDPIERLVRLFDRETAELVEAVNKPKGIDDKAALAAAYRQQMLNGPQDTGIIKMPDTFDNLTTLLHLPMEKRLRKVAEYADSEPVYTRALGMPGARAEGLILYSWVRQAIADAEAA